MFKQLLANKQALISALENPFISEEMQHALVADLTAVTSQITRLTTYRTRSGFRRSARHEI